MTRLLPLILLLAVSASAETFRFRTGIFDRDLGYEQYTLTGDASSAKLVAHFEMSDRGTLMPLDVELTTGAGWAPRHFTVRGKPDRFGQVDRSHTIEDSSFPLAGFRPASVLMMLIRYWIAHGEPKTIDILPAGRVTVTRVGTDLTLTRYRIEGLGSNDATVWLDAQQHLAAAYLNAVGVSGTQVVREDLVAHHDLFVRRSEESILATLRQMSTSVSPKEGLIALTNARIVDVERGTVIENGTVVVRNGIISAVGPRVRIPRGATVIDVAGKSVLPGLWDMHAHVEEIAWMPRYLAAGVTTVRDVGNKASFETALRDAVARREVLGPRMLLAGVIDGEGPTAVGSVRVKNAEEARAAVQMYRQLGVDQIKVYNSITPEQLRAITDEAHRSGLTVTGHIPATMTLREALDLGLDQINHIAGLARGVYALPELQQRRGTVATWSDLDLERLAAVVKLLKERRVVYDPTLALYELITRPLDEPFETIEPEAKRLPAAVAEEVKTTGVAKDRVDAARTTYRNLAAAVRKLHEAGVTIVAGADIAVPGFGLWRELELYVKNGFTPMEALQAATIVPARVMKRDRDSGSLAKGKRADLIVVDGDPTKSISDLRRTELVMAGGRLYETEALWRVAGYGAR